jgi:DNA polymerase-3 subunit beta
MLARTLVPVDVAQGGEIAVDVRRFNDLIRAVPEKQIIEVSSENEDSLLVKSGRSRFRLPSLAAAQYPRMAASKDERISITMSAERLCGMIGEVVSSMANADVRYYLNGALLSIDKEGIWLVSTDGNRMTVSREPIVGSETLAPMSVIVPRKSMLLAKKLLKHGGNVTLTLCARNVQFSFDDGTMLFAKSVDAAYPNWRNVIPACTECASLSATRMAAALTMLATTAVGNEKQAVLKDRLDIDISGGVAILRRGEIGVCEIECASSANASHKVSVNLNFLADAVTTLQPSADEVVIGYSANVSAFTLRPKDKDYPLCVLMPLRI